LQILAVIPRLPASFPAAAPGPAHSSAISPGSGSALDEDLVVQHARSRSPSSSGAMSASAPGNQWTRLSVQSPNLRDPSRGPRLVDEDCHEVKHINSGLLHISLEPLGTRSHGPGEGDCGEPGDCAGAVPGH